jgi:hypothetical protein
MVRTAILEELSRRCRARGDGAPPVQASGSSGLDAVLPGGGWPGGVIVELMPCATGIGELRLLMPALARITREGRLVALISPPFLPFAPALSQRDVRLDRLLVIDARKREDALWVCEQTLRSKSFGAVLAWPESLKDREARRLQLAAEAGNSIGFLYRSPATAGEPSPAALRLRLQATPKGELRIDVLKCRGGRGGISAYA